MNVDLNLMIEIHSKYILFLFYIFIFVTTTKHVFIISIFIYFYRQTLTEQDYVEN